jgi:hypothetical protein
MRRLLVIALWAGTAAISQVATAADGDAPAEIAAATPCHCGAAVCTGCQCRDRHAQSGYGLCVAPWAQLTYGPKYKSYYVGGSVVPWPWSWRVVPEPRFPWEGTWGRDYSPRLAGVSLWWSHGPLYQDGIGQYEPDRRNVPFYLRFGKATTTVR